MDRETLLDLAKSYSTQLKDLGLQMNQMKESKEENDLKPGAKDKDKYKALARRLKEERNQYKDTCEEKL